MYIALRILIFIFIPYQCDLEGKDELNKWSFIFQVRVLIYKTERLFDGYVLKRISSQISTRFSHKHISAPGCQAFRVHKEIHC